MKQILSSGHLVNFLWVYSSKR